MARSSGGAGSRFASSNLNDLYGKPAIASSTSKSRYGSSASSSGPQSGGGMLVLARPGSRGAPHKSLKPPQPKLTVPAPVNLPSLRKEHAGNDPGINLVSASATPGASGWSKQQQQPPPLDPQLEPGSHNPRISPGWASAATPIPQPSEHHPGLISRSGKYTPPGARGGNPATNPPNPAVNPAQPVSMVVLRGEDFPTLQASAPFNPVPPQQKLREMQQRQREKIKSQVKDEVYKPAERLERPASPPPPLALQPQQRQRDEGLIPRGFNSLKENRKPNDFSLRPGPLLHLNHTSNWAEDERESAGSKGAPEWEDGPRYYNQREAPRFQREGGFRREFEREGGHAWGFGRGDDHQRSSGWGRERENYPFTSFLHENFGGGFHKGRFSGRNGAVDLPVRARGSYNEDSFMRDFPELPNLDMRYKMRRKRNDGGDAGYRDLERESFETELERVQKEQEQERQRRVEERERAMEAARREQEERERAAREEEERRRRAEEEAAEAAARAEVEAFESVRKVEEGRRFREEERRRAAEEEDIRKQNARRKLLELEERMAMRERSGEEAHHPPPPPPPPPPPAPRLDEDDERGPLRFPSPRMHQHHQQQQLRPGDHHHHQSLSSRREREERWMANGGIHSPRMSMENAFMEDERRWGRRTGPFSPPSPTSPGASAFGGGYDDGFPYGRLRQSLPKQPRVPPPPPAPRAPVQRPPPVFQEVVPEAKIVVSYAVTTPEGSDRVSTPDTEDRAESCVVDDEKLVEVEVEFSSQRLESGDEQELKELEASAESSLEVVSEVEVVVVEAVEVVDAAVTERDTGFEIAEEQPEFHEEEKLPELVEAPVVIQSEAEEEVVEIEVIVPPAMAAEEEPGEKEEKRMEPEEASEIVQLHHHHHQEAPAADSRPLLPSPFHQQQGFHQHQPFMPFDPRPRLQGPPHSDRPMTLQFGLLPGTSLLQGSIPAIQIGSIQMPLQLHPPIGHPVAHLQPPPQFQFGQIGQQAPLLPFTVHPQAMLQQSMMNLEAPGQQFRMQPHPDRTFWAGHYVPRKNSSAEKVEEVQSSGENEKSKEEAPAFEEAPPRAAQAPGSGSVASAAEGGEEDDFIEVRSKRQLLNDRREQKEKVKSKPKYMKAKEQAAKQKHGSKSSQIGTSKEAGKKESSTLRNVSLDAVVTTARSRQLSLSNAEVGFEKRTKSPQPQINSLVSDAPAFPPIVAEGQSTTQANGPVAWGFNRANQEAMGLSHTQLEEAMKPGRFEVPVQQQPDLEAPTSAGSKDKNPGPSAPINSLLAGEKIQFGAVTMPAFVSPVPWLGPPRPEAFRKETPEESELINKGKRLRESDDAASGMDSEAEAEAAASAVAVAAITNDDFVHSSDQLGVIGNASSKGSPSGQTSEMDESINVSLPADLSVDLPLRGPPQGQLLPSIPGSFPGMEMGTLLERPGPGWQPHHSAVDSFYGGPHSYAGPFINHHHGPIPSIPPHTLVYTSPFGGVGQFGQLGMSYMSPAHMPPVKQPDWKHTPTSSGSGEIGGLGGGIHYAQHNNRHLPHDPSVVPVVPPPGPFDVYRDMSFQSQWSGPHPMPGFPMHLRHPHPAFHLHQQQQQHPLQMPGEMMGDSSAQMMQAQGSPAEFPDEILGDTLSTTSDANSAFVLQQQQPPTVTKPSSPGSQLPAGSKLRSRVMVPPVDNNNNSNNSRPQSSGNSGGSNSSGGFQGHSYVSTVTGGGARRQHQHQQQQDKKSLSTQQQQQQHTMGGKVGAGTGWSNNNSSRKTGPGRSGSGGGGVSASEKSGGGSSGAMAAGKLKQVYVAKPAVVVNHAGNNESCSEMFTADARHM